MTIEKPFHYDIVIVGAGLVGTSVVAGLQNSGFRIAVLEKHLPAIIDGNAEDSRPLSLAYGGQRCLDRWGLWSALSASALPIQRLHVSEKGHLGRVLFSAGDYDLPALGYVVPFSLLQRELYQCAASQPEVDFISIEKITALDCNEKAAHIDFVTANKQRSLSASLLIAADGAQSACRDLLHIPTKEDGSDEVAFIATLQFEQSHQSMAYQRFTHDGSLALLPLFDSHQMRLVWTMKKTFHEKLCDWSDEKLLTIVGDAYGGRLNKLVNIQRDVVFPLQTIVTEEAVQPSMALLGNAAHTIYPVAAQGFNLGLQDAAALTRLLMRAKQQGESIGALSTLQRYVEHRQKNQRAVIQWTERIANVFHWRIPCLDHARGIALLGLDMLPPVKENFARNFLHV